MARSSLRVISHGALVGLLGALISCTLTQGLGDYDKGPGDGGSVCKCTLPNTATTRCDGAGKCLVSSCNPGFANCNGTPDDGCECGFANAQAECGGAAATPSAVNACQLGVCSAGFGNCNGNASDGCETSLDTDPNHCGSCGHGCNGASCAGGRCLPVVLAPDQPGAGQIVFDGAWIYWTNYGDSKAQIPGGVMRIRFDGAELKAVAQNQSRAWGVGVLDSEGDVFWTTYAVGEPSVLASAPKDGSSATAPMKWVQTPNASFRGMAIEKPTRDVSTKDIFYAVYKAVPTDGGVGVVPGIYKYERATQQSKLLVAATAPNAVVVDEKNVYFTDEGTQGASTGQVVSFPRTAKDGSEAKILAKDLNNPRGLFVDAQGVYWVNVGSGKGVRDGSVEMLSKTTSGYGAKVTLASNLSDARELAVDETRVYWTSYQDNTISAVAKNSDGSLAPVILVQNAPGSTVVSHPLAIATDAKYIYWSNYDGTMLSTGSKGAIMRVLKN